MLNISLLFSQSCQGPLLLAADFNDDSIPANWTILNLDGNSLYWTTLAKGYTGEWQPYSHYGRRCVTSVSRYGSSFDHSDDYLITAAITLGAAPVCLSWKSARAYDTPSFTDETYDVMISTSGPTAIGLHSNPALLSVTESHENWVDYSVDLSAYAGQTVYIGFWQYTSGGYALCLDDIKIATPVNTDAAATSLNISDLYQPGTTISISGEMVNGGLSIINSFSLNWNVDGGITHTDNLSGLNIASQEYHTFASSLAWNPSSSGTYRLKVWTSNVNGANDDYALNDTITQVVYVSNYPRKVLMEEFTNASCGPCAIQNPAYDALIDANREIDKVTAVKYHVAWPGVDLMNDFNPEDAEERVAYYGVYGVPYAVTDGSAKTLTTTCYTGQPSCIDQAYLDSLNTVPSIFEIAVGTSTDGSNYVINAKITAETDIPDSSFTAYVILLEDTINYIYPPGTNGEIVFNEVLRKMLPTNDGTPLPSFLNGESVILNFSTLIELQYNENQLRALVFIQNENGKKIYQSEMTKTNYETSTQLSIRDDEHFTVYPNPANNFLMITSKANFENATVIIDDAVGKEVLKFNLRNPTTSHSLDISDLNAGVYFLRIETSNSIVIQKIVKQ